MTTTKELIEKLKVLPGAVFNETTEQETARLEICQRDYIDNILASETLSDYEKILVSGNIRNAFFGGARYQHAELQKVIETLHAVIELALSQRDRYWDRAYPIEAFPKLRESYQTEDNQQINDLIAGMK